MHKAERGRPFIIGITGTPGVGKSYFSRRLGSAFDKNGIVFKIIEINDVVISSFAYDKIDRMGSLVISRKKLKKAMENELNGNKITIIVGHLLPDIGIKTDVSIVLRLDLLTLFKRLKKRKYEMAKIRENIIAEAYDDIGGRSMRISKELYEAECKDRRDFLIKYICSTIKGKKMHKPKTVQIDKFEELKKLILDNNAMGF